MWYNILIYECVYNFNIIEVGLTIKNICFPFVGHKVEIKGDRVCTPPYTK
jgi:hypothetical protein